MISYSRLHWCWQASSTALLIVWEKSCTYKFTNFGIRRALVRHTLDSVCMYMVFVPLLWNNNKDKNMSCSSMLVSSTFTNKYSGLKANVRQEMWNIFSHPSLPWRCHCSPPPPPTVSLQGSSQQCIFNLYLSSSYEPGSYSLLGIKDNLCYICKSERTCSVMLSHQQSTNRIWSA